jgi:hypothetical protein
MIRARFSTLLLVRSLYHAVSKYNGSKSSQKCLPTKVRYFVLRIVSPFPDKIARKHNDLRFLTSASDSETMYDELSSVSLSSSLSLVLSPLYLSPSLSLSPLPFSSSHPASLSLLHALPSNPVSPSAIVWSCLLHHTTPHLLTYNHLSSSHPSAFLLVVTSLICSSLSGLAGTSQLLPYIVRT